jgi:MYXO-CTERM domain-containing protein
MLLDAGRAVAVLDIEEVSRFGPGVCVRPDGWTFGVAVRTGANWQLATIDDDGRRRRIALTDEPISAVAGSYAAAHGCSMALVTRDGHLWQIDRGGDIVERVAVRREVDDPNELFQGVFLEVDGDAIAVGRRDGLAFVGSGARVRHIELAGGEPVGAGVVGDDGLWVMTRRGVLHHIGRQGSDSMVVYDGATPSRTGLTVWRDRLVWGDERGRVLRYDAEGAQVVCETGEPIRHPLLAVDIYDEAVPALVAVTTTGRWWAVHDRGTEAFGRSRRPATSSALWMRATEPPALVAPLSGTDSHVLPFEASPAATIHRDGAAPMAGWQVRDGRTRDGLRWSGLRPPSPEPTPPDEATEADRELDEPRTGPSSSQPGSGCAVAARRTPTSGLWLLLAAVGLAAGRQRRRRPADAAHS